MADDSKGEGPSSSRALAAERSSATVEAGEPASAMATDQKGKGRATDADATVPAAGQARERAARDAGGGEMELLEVVRGLTFPAAAQPEIIRANQKDRFYLLELQEQVETVARTLIGTRWLQTWSDEVREAGRLAYFSLTTLLGSQTLGEEYCDIMQYSVRTESVPSPFRRGALVLAHIVLPYAISKLYGRFRRRMTAIREGAVSTTDRMTKALASVEWPSFDSLVDNHFRSVHLAVFYLTGRYYHLAKRLVGIRYISTQTRRPGAQAQPPSYEVLGVLMTIQLTVRIVRAILQRRRRLREEKAIASGGSTLSKKEQDKREREKLRKRATVDAVPINKHSFDPEDPAPPADEDEIPKYAWGEPPEDSEEGKAEEGEAMDSHARRCTLCLGARREPAATPCGHVFCWECIVGWAREKPECPLCRQDINLSHLLPVYNL